MGEPYSQRARIYRRQTTAATCVRLGVHPARTGKQGVSSFSLKQNKNDKPP